MSIFRQLMVALTVALPLLANAVPANRTPRVFTQPDGSEVTLRQMGDEFFHYYLTDDSKMVLQLNGAFYFAAPAANGQPMATQMLASDASHRTPAQTQALATIDKQQMLSYGTRQANARRARYRSLRPATGVARAAAATSDWPSGIGLFPGNSYPVTGSPRALIILVQYKDQNFSLPNAKEYFTGLASQPGFSQLNAHGSALDYFTAASNGKFTPQFDVLGPVTLPNNMAYYGANDSNGDDVRPAEMVRDAVKALDATTDFSVYDNDGDGVIDNVYVIYSGMGEASGGADDTIWPHSWDIAGANISLKVDGKSVRSYACSAEYLEKGLADGIGTFCHEFSHVMGLPDLYTTDYNDAAVDVTPGSYSLMDHGSYNNDSRTPPTYSIYERNAMGWADVEELKAGEPRKVALGHMLETNKGYVIGTGKTNEFFLLENRQKTDWDAYLPGHGMLVWHIDYNENVWTNNEPNNNYSHQYIDIVEAGGQANNSSTSVLAQYPFPGTKKVTSLTSSTNPALISWGGKAIDVPITAIAETPAGMINFNVCGGEQIDKPVCNITGSVVESETPVEITLALPSTAKAGDEIHYIYMYNDGSDMADGVYSGPITLSKSAEFEYWTQRGDLSSDVTTIHVYVGEKAPVISSYRIVYLENSSDNNSVLTPATYPDQCEEGADIASFNSSSSKVYAGQHGLKISSSKVNGTLALDLNSDYQKNYTKVVVNACSYGSDASAISVNGSAAQSISGALTDYTFTLDGSKLSSLQLAATKRVYIRSITLYAEDSETPGVQTVATPAFSVASGEIESGTVVTISTDTPGASIHYTIDGSAPTSESTPYTSAGITVTDPVTIRAIALKDGWKPSEIASVSYTIAGGDIVGDTDSYIIVYSDGGNEGTQISASNYAARCEEGAEAASYVSSTRVYFGNTGIKFGSSKGGGTISLAINPDYQKKATSVIVKAKSYGSDTSTLNVNSIGARSVTSELGDYEFNLSGSENLTDLTLTSEKRLYVKSIEVKYKKPTSVESLSTDSFDAAPVYYTLQGIPVAQPQPGQIYICRRGTKVNKIIWK